MNMISLWLKKEQKDLPVLELVEKEYVTKLMALAECQKSLAATHRIYTGTFYSPKDVIDDSMAKKDESNTRKAEKVVFNFSEQKWKLLRDIQWIEVEKQMQDDKWVQMLHKLEGLVVARIFEMARMNSSGYKMWAHLSKALTARSGAIQSAIDSLNKIAAQTSYKNVEWKKMVDYIYLSKFDILKHTGDKDIHNRLWAKPAYHKCLYVEIKRLIAYIKEEDMYLQLQQAELTATNPNLAYQIGVHC
ncbi:hypothetical protein Moror_9288 [Moniliophthora roreri MCA 2997]|uniref:Uncharacterized protein n=1 Tax=Moniliophthora roreri (strain MCA 2997) TaxID=1381753 RepID=V2X155_MONRO|nr:hypothetical protein Moror_9288 [Moniliophthora roreri MCA 2997]